ncbi:DUF3575 domain-containing protein [Phocaeicola vulgatus]|uniref:DUF3575 domain-containing protein n=1 Tax=Phocaeicola vulgatus TaxID=821 RepID=UPI001F2A499D|nr:DUF3575 domain-containing protein [Phocaeicola vulgatus]MCG0155424.1 DUF3575 domain-containing protein [Phocaeicola vulgatus]MCG0329360.1 DUF3575 domain-containing protein [Phocaeicola vulgatus]MCG0333245.1 DUF3575 domain-containing protein [Phocaeicola vulgatus]
MKRVLLLLMIVVFSFPQELYSQKVAVKSNLLSDFWLNPNLGLEVGLAPKWTLEVDGQFNAWTLSNDKRWKHWAVQPGVRYWLCDRFGGHYFGAYLHGGQYNAGGINLNVNFLGTDFRKLENTRYQGWFVGGGVSYGHAFMLSRHWNLETEIGIGYSYTHYDRFRCAGCGKKIETNKPHHYVGPTKAAINLVYLF